MILVGNKADLSDEHRRVSQEDAQAKADEWGMSYIETSAKLYTNVDEAFMSLVTLIHQRKAATMNGFNKDKKKKKKKKFCSLL